MDEYGKAGPSQNVILVIDSWLSLRVPLQVVTYLYALRRRLSTCFAATVDNPREALPEEGQGALNAIASAFSFESGGHGVQASISRPVPHPGRGRASHAGGRHVHAVLHRGYQGPHQGARGHHEQHHHQQHPHQGHGSLGTGGPPPHATPYAGHGHLQQPREHGGSRHHQGGGHRGGPRRPGMGSRDRR
eukprot:jgi/Botrbrau1/10829/Bobra.0025s0008.1